MKDLINKIKAIDPKIIIVVSATIILTLTIVSFNRVPSGEVVAKIGSYKIYKDQANELLKNAFGAPEGFQFADMPVEQQKMIALQIYSEDQLIKEANNSSVAKQPEIKNAIKAAKQKIVKDAFLRDIATKAATREAIEAKYQELSEKLAKEYEGKEEVKASHILTKTKAEADRLYFKLNAKKISFEQAAKEKSIDKSSAQRDGDLGYFVAGKMVKEFEAKAFSTKVGNISRPFKTQFGWHIIKVTDKRAAQVPNLTDLYDQIKQEISYETVSQYLQNLKGDAEVELFTTTASNSAAVEEKAEEGK